VLKNLLKIRRGQIAVEYVMLIIITIAVLLLMQVYVKRGIQGRWKKNIDDLQAGARGKVGASFYYDPRYSNTLVEEVNNCETLISVVTRDAGSARPWTSREDGSSCQNSKTGFSATAGFDPFSVAPPASF
jgi:hypothetical protein